MRKPEHKQAAQSTAHAVAPPGPETVPARPGSAGKLPKSRFHLVFSLIMGAMMVFIMTFFITLINLGFPPDFFMRWMKAYAIAYVIAVPVIYFLAPIARRIAGRFAEMP